MTWQERLRQHFLARPAPILEHIASGRAEKSGYGGVRISYCKPG
jgi:hypothetical protein